MSLGATRPLEEVTDTSTQVYCGTCMNNRKRKTNKGTKGKGRADEPVLPPPFSTCRADDCGLRVSHKNDVMQIFL